MELDLEGCLMEWNTAAERIFGFAREEVIGKDFRHLIVPEALRNNIGHCLAKLLTGASEPGHMHENITKDGRTILCEWSTPPFAIPMAASPASPPSARTSRRNTAPPARSRTSPPFPRYNPNPVMQFSEEGELVYFNESAEEMARSLGKQKVPEILPPDVAVAVRECLDSGGIQVRRETKMNSRTISWAFFPFPPSVACIATPRTPQSGSTWSSSSANRKKCNPSASSPPASRMTSITSSPLFRAIASSYR